MYGFTQSPAQLDLEELRADPYTPIEVIRAAKSAILRDEIGLSPSKDDYHILASYAAKLQRQNRYGK